MLEEIPPPMTSHLRRIPVLTSAGKNGSESALSAVNHICYSSVVGGSTCRVPSSLHHLHFHHLCAAISQNSTLVGDFSLAHHKTASCKWGITRCVTRSHPTTCSKTPVPRIARHATRLDANGRQLRLRRLQLIRRALEHSHLTVTCSVLTTEFIENSEKLSMMPPRYTKSLFQLRSATTPPGSGTTGTAPDHAGGSKYRGATRSLLTASTAFDPANPQTPAPTDRQCQLYRNSPVEPTNSLSPSLHQHRWWVVFLMRNFARSPEFSRRYHRTQGRCSWRAV